MRRFESKVALITGGGSGIGRATARLLAGEGARVMVDDIDAAGGEETVRTIRSAGGEAAFVHADVRDRAQCRAMVQATLDGYGGLDFVHANAGVPGLLTPVAECPLDDLQLTIDTNLIGVIYTCQAAIPAMAGRGGGSIVLMASLAGRRGNPGLGVYGATKAGLILLAMTMARECGPMRIRVNAVAPGIVDTPMNVDILGTPEDRQAMARRIALGRVGEPEDVAKAIAFLASDEASWITGITLPVDGGDGFV
jgi:NAD(P)-dependent dehydrogenase (short-subunit alcohol dehydrogenase family)